MVQLSKQITTLLSGVDLSFADAAIRHQVLVGRFATGEANRILRFLDRTLYPEIVREVERGIKGLAGNVSPWRQKRYLEMMSGVKASIKNNMSLASGRLRNSLGQFASSESAWNASALKRVLPLETSFRLASPFHLNAIVNSQPFQGEHLKGWFDGLSRNLQTSVSREIRTGIGLGESVPNLVRRLEGTSTFRGAFGASRDHARTVVRTSITHVSARARQATFDANKDVVKGVRYVATLDSRTSPTCAALDQLTDPGDLGEARPPQHLNCRSTIVPVLKSLKELGFKDLKEPKQGKRFSRTPAGKRKLVPGGLNYDQWLRRQPEWFQMDVLGRQKFSMFKRGVPMRKFVDANHRPLSLSGLKRLESRIKRSSASGSFSPMEQALRPLTENQKRRMTRLEGKLSRGEKLTPTQLSDVESFRRRAARFHPELVGRVTPLPPSPKVVIPRKSLTSKQQLQYERLLKKEAVGSITDNQALRLAKFRSQLGISAPPKPGTLTLSTKEAPGASLTGAQLRKLVDLAFPAGGVAIQEPGAAVDLIHRLLKVSDPIGIKLTGGKLAASSTAQKARKWLQARVSRRLSQGGKNSKPVTEFVEGVMEVRVKKAGRYDRASASYDGSIHMPEFSPRRTYVHELGHQIEFSSRLLADERRLFMRYRGRGRRPKKLRELDPNHGYTRGEIVIEDEYIDPYMGKLYSYNGDATSEIISMGLEQLYANPIGLMRKDPEYFDWIIDVIRGNRTKFSQYRGVSRNQGGYGLEKHSDWAEFDKKFGLPSSSGVSEKSILDIAIQ